MVCIKYGSSYSEGFVCGYNRVYKLPLADGRRVFMEWHRFLGPTLFHDRNRHREIENWFENQQICDAVQWFQNRGNRA